uniref:Protein kinase domain-containing protein n=1 Tax=Oryza rufipogon TaxID=4529 RepID=A0A0E0QU88_ORYRU
MANSKRLPYSTAGGGGGGGGGGGRRGGASGSGVVAPLVVLVFLFVLAPSIFFVARNGGHVHVASDPKDREGNQETDWQKQLATNNLKSILSKEMIDALASSQQEAGTLSVDFFRKRASPSWKTDDLVNDLSNASLDVDDKVKSENSSAEHELSLTDKTPKDDTAEHQVDAAAKNARRKLREKRREKRAMDLVRKDDEARVKLENAAIERSKAVDSAVLGKYSIWRKENENENSDSTVRLMRDQIIMARVYSVLAKSKNKNDLYQELQTRIKESQRAVGEATADSDLHHSAPEKVRVMGQLLSKAREDVYDCKAVTQRLRAMLQSADEQVRSLKKQSTFLSQLAAKTIPNSIHCLSMRLTIDYYLLPLEKRKFPRSENLENPELYHYALFSDNVLAASVVVNSTIMNAKEPEKHVFHLVTDKLNFGAMNMWFLLNPPGKATIHVENVDEFKWLNSSYCPVLRQLESAAMKEYYFKADRPTTLSAGSSNLKYRNPKYLSMLNHLRFYLPQVYPKLDKILFLDDDIVVQKDLKGLWDVDLNGKVNGAVETCGESFHRFDKYLNFSNPHIARNFDPNACGWAYGMNIFDLKEWKKKDITGIYHKWQSMNEDRVLWKLGTLPPGLLTFYKLTHPLDKSWHVLGLGYNPSIDRSEIDNAAVVHYNGNMKPWLELAMTKYRPYWTRYIKYDHPYIRGCNLAERRGKRAARDVRALSGEVDPRGSYPSLEMANSKRLPYSTAGGGGGGRRGVVAPLVVVVFLFVLAPSIFFVACNGGHVGSDPMDMEGTQETEWQKQLPTNNLKSILSKEMFDALASSQQEAGALSVDFFIKRASPSWKTDDLVNDLSNASLDIDDKVKSANSSTDKTLKDDTDSAVLGKYSIWRKENENENSDLTVRLMRDQIIMARVYSVLAKSKNKNDLYQELQTRIKESQRAVGEATADSDLHHSAPEKVRVMGQLLSKAREDVYDCKAVTQRLRAMLQSADEQVRSLKKQSTFLSQLAAKTIPNSIHCLSMRLTIDYYLLPLEKRKFPRSENLENPELYHYALFSDNVLAASVVNSTIMNAKEPEKHVFHLVTDKLNFGAMNMWFLLNPPGKATIHVENVDEFKWLNSSYCPVLRQLESAAMKEYYFKADRPTTLSAGSSNLKYRNPKYLSMLNHLRFYLPQVYPKLDKIFFLDDDIVVQKDLTGLWDVDLNGKVTGAVETCGESFHRFDKYLNFSNPHIARNFDPNACGWAYGMNIFDLNEWKKKDITGIYHRWQNMNEDRVLWKLGTLPHGLLTFFKLTHPLDKSWHVLGLGYNPSIDRSEIDNAAVVHYNGNMKPWLELAMTKYDQVQTILDKIMTGKLTDFTSEGNNIVNLKQFVACLLFFIRILSAWPAGSIDCCEEMINRCFCCVTGGDSDPEPAATSSRRRTNPARASKNRTSVDYPWETYTLKELLQATGNFSESNKLGEGGFGTVYWGRTSKGVEIAVKRLKAMTAKAEMEFAVEVEILGRVRHRNLLSLRGFYAGGDERLIVYDYMPNHSLLTHLHPHRGTPSSHHHVPLEWPRRVAIAVGAAEGLSYLHHEASPHIIHRDIKASNVLLDAEFVPKVADFGFAKLIPDGVSHLTTRVKGTLGYLAPEYAMWGKVSESCDVYSFGVLLLELVSARRPLEKLPGGVKREIVQWAAPLVERRRWERLADPRLAGRFDAAQLRAVVETAMLCTQSSAESRPAMAEVVDMLRFSGGERRTKEIVPVAATVAGSSDEITMTTDQDDVTAGSSEPLDRRNWKLTRLR